MKQKIKTVALQTLSALFTILLCTGFWGLGFFLSFKGYMTVNRPLWTAICILCATIVLALIVINIVGGKVLSKKLSDMKMREIYDWSETIKADTEKNYQRTEKSVRRTIALVYLYVAAVILLLLVCCFGAGVLLNEEADSLGFAILILIVIFFVAWGLTDVFFAPLVSPAPPAEYMLKESRFPLLYETVRKAAEKSRCRKKISVCAYGEGVSVSSYKNSAIICINYIHAAVFTRDELYNVMLHEFAHVNNADVKRAIKFSRAEQRLDSSANGNFIIDFGKMILLPLPSVAVIFKTNAYNVFASLYHEMKADKALKELGDPQKSVDALAKSKMISIYNSLPYRELDYDFYAPEQPGGDYAAQNVALFLKQRDIQGAKWRELINKELPARVASHPAFSNRMAALGCQSYDAYRDETDPDYIAEQRDIIKFADEVMTAEYSGNYQNMREDYYLKRKKEIDEYAAAVKNGEPVPDSALFTYLQAHFGVDDDTAIEIADKMIAVLPDPSYANYYKGMILFNRIDDGCVEYFKAVAASTDDYELAMNAVSFIGEYALKTGNKELLNEYRSTAPETVQISRDKGERNKLKNDSVLEKCDLGESVLRQIIDGIDKELLKNVTAIYIAAYTDGDGGRHYPVSVSVKGANAAKTYEILNNIYNYLFDYRGKYDFILLPPNSPLFGKVKKNGAQVYDKKNDKTTD